MMDRGPSLFYVWLHFLELDFNGTSQTVKWFVAIVIGDKEEALPQMLPWFDSHMIIPDAGPSASSIVAPPRVYDNSTSLPYWQRLWIVTHTLISVEGKDRESAKEHV